MIIYCKLWKNYDSLYDLNHDEEGVLIKNSVTGGLTVFFGNGNFGKNPPLGSIINVSYIKTRGSAGNIGGKKLSINFLPNFLALRPKFKIHFRQLLHST